MTLSLDRINRARESGYDDDQIVEAISKRDPEFGQRVQRAKESGHNSTAILQTIEKKLNAPLNTPVNTPAPQQNTPAQPTSSPEFPDNSNVKRLDIAEKESNVKPGFEANKQSLTPVATSVPDSTQTMIPKKDNTLGHTFTQGLKQSASGEIARQVFNDKSKDEVAQDPGFWEQIVHSAGTLTGDAPYLLAGTTLGGALGASLGSVAGPTGSAVGGVTGGAFGALAMPAFIKEALKEYRDYVDKGNDLTFGEFLSKADRVASKTLREGAFGVILGSINKAAPLLSKIPGLGNLFTSKIAQKATILTGETVAAATIPAASEGRLPTKNDFAQAAALILGMNLLHLPAKLREKIQKAGEASGKTPEEFAKSPEVKEIINETEKVNEKREVQVEQPKSEANQKTETPNEKVVSQQELEKQQVKEFEQKVENKEADSIQKKIDVIEDRIKKAEAKGKSQTVRVLQKNLSIQKKRLQEAKAARKYSVPQNSKEVNTTQPTLVAKNPEKINNVNVVQAISEKPKETLAKGAYVPTGQQPGFAPVTKAIKGAKANVRAATKWVFKKAGQDILQANTQSDIYKKGWRAVEDYMSTKMGLKEKFFTRWQDAIGKNKRISRQDREDMIFYRERTGNPFVKDDTFEALNARISPESKEVVDTIVDQHMKESLRLINESPFMSGKGVTPRQAVEDIYIRHFYAGKISPQKVDAIFESMQKRFGTDNPFKNTRTYLTFDQALREAGLVPKYRDITQNLAAQDGMLTRVLSNNELVSNLHDLEVATGQKLIVRSNDKTAYQKAKEDGWIQFQDPYMRSYVSGTNKAGKKNWAVTEAPALVHPDLAPSLQGLFAKDAYKPDNAVLRLYDAVNSTMNKLHVSASLFHFNALGESFTSQGGFVTSLVMSPKWWKQGSRLLDNSPMVEDAVRNGLKLNRPTDLDLEQANTFYQKLLTKLQASNNLPLNIVGKIGENANALNRVHKFLFGEFQPRMKIITYENYVNRMLQYYEKKGMYPNEELLRDIKRQSAKATNDQFGGQVWELVPFMNQYHKKFHRVAAFPDWTLSAIKEVTGAVADNSPIRRKLGQRYLVEYLMGLFFGGQLLSYANTGMTNKPDGSITWDLNKAHSTFENEDPKRRNLFDIEMPDFYITIAGDKINLGRDENGRKYFMHGGKKIREIGRYFTDPIANLFSKSSPLIQDATKFALDHTPSEGGLFPVRGAYVEGEFKPWDGTKKHTIDRAISYAKEIAGGTLPYSLQTAISDLFDSKEQFMQAIARTGFKFLFSGGGGLSVSKGISLRSSEPYWEQAYNIKNPKEREESLKALRVVLKDYGYKDRQIKTIQSKIKRRVEGKAEKR